MADPRTASLERKYRLTAPLYDILDWPWERQYRTWRPEIVGDVRGRILEVGVGTGHNLAHYPPGIEVEAVDLSEAMLARARRRAQAAPCRVTLRRANALDLDHVPDASIDWYIATFLFCVLPDPLQPPALAEMARVLAPGGRFRLVEILYSQQPTRRLTQRLLAPCVQAVYGARFDRRTREHLAREPRVSVTRTRWLKQDTHLLIEGSRAPNGTGTGEGGTNESASRSRAQPPGGRVTGPRTRGGIPGLLALPALVLAGCGERGADAEPPEWLAQIDTIGDTVVVRTLEGSEWGRAELLPELRIGVLEGAEHEMLGEVVGLAVDAEGHIYLYDRLVPALRKYAPDGEYLGTLGRHGGGPGEYENSDGGIVALPDGRVVLRDPGNGRFTVYASDGAYLESWPARAGAFTSIPLLRAASGEFYSYAFGAGRPGLVRHAGDGTPLDTLALPDRDVVRQTVTAQVEGMSQTWGVPFTPSALWSLHSDGYFLSAVSDRYAIDLLRTDGPTLRLERELEPVPASRAERIAEEGRVTEAMRRVDPSWRWEGPAIPQTKPLLRAIHGGEEGRIWVQLHQPGEPVPEEELEPGPDGGPPLPRFREATVFDVFEADGRYLGQVVAPDELPSYPRPIFRGEHVWSVVRDALGIQYVVRYRVVPEGTAGGRSAVE